MPNTGLIYAASVSNDASAGTVAWTNTSNAAGNNTNDATFAYAANSGLVLTTQYLSFAFTHGIAAGNDIIGITVAFRRYASDTDDIGNLAQDLTIKLVKNGAIVGNNKSSGAQWPKDVGAWSSDFGGASDVWGSSFVYSDTIGVVLRANIPGAYDFARVTAARATFYFQAQASGVKGRRSVNSRSGSRCEV